MSAKGPTHVRVFIEEEQTEITVPSVFARAVGLKPIEGKVALNKHGRPLPPKRKTDLAGEPVGNGSDQPAVEGEPVNADADQPAARKTTTSKTTKED